MGKQFFNDLHAAKGAEEVVLLTFSALLPDHLVENVSDDSNFYHIGDIRVTAPDGHVRYIEVKDDGCICRTRNVLCEEAHEY